MTHSFHLIYITPQKRPLLMRKRAVITLFTVGKNQLYVFQQLKVTVISVILGVKIHTIFAKNAISSLFVKLDPFE